MEVLPIKVERATYHPTLYSAITLHHNQEIKLIIYHYETK